MSVHCHHGYSFTYTRTYLSNQPVPTDVPGFCSFNRPACNEYNYKCDLTAPTANSTGGVCRPEAQCPSCPSGYECVKNRFPPSLPWCRKLRTCDSPCSSNSFCDYEWWLPYLKPSVSTNALPVS